MTIIGEAYIAVKPDTQGFAANAEKGVLGSVTGIAKKAAGIIGGAFVVQKGFDFLKDAVGAARESNAVAAQTEAVIKSTGAAAGVTAKQVDQLSDSLSRKTGIDDEQISKAQNLLLTFTNVRNEAGKGNDVFNQATAILTDMSAALGTDVSGSAIQLGKALNDPIAGISALTRVGVTFSEKQKETIKRLVETGKTAEAQKIILAELGKEFGGSAEAQATAADRLKVTLGNLQEEIGNKLVPVIDKVAGFLADKLPGALDTAGQAFGRIKDIVGPIVEQAGRLLYAFQGALSGEGITSDGLFGKVEGVGVLIRDLVEAIKEQIAGIVAFVQENAPKFEEAFGHIINAAKAIFETLEPIVRPILEFFIKDVIARIEYVVEIFKNVALLITNIINGDFGAAFGNLKNIVGAAIEFVVGTLGRLAGLIGGLVPAIFGAAKKMGAAILDGIGNGLASAVGFAGDVAAGVLRAIKNLINTQIIDRLNNGIPNSLGAGPLRIDLPDNPIPRLAHGALIRARPGGIIANIAEGRHDEAVLPLPAGVIEGLQAIAARGAAAGEALVGQLVVQGATVEGAYTTAISVVRELKAEAWRVGK